jgi:hypothetical protein
MDALVFLYMPAFMLLIVITSVWHFRRSRGLLDRWAERNGYRIIDSEYRKFFRGPFFWSTSKDQTVYRVTVELEKGRMLTGWVRCGSRFLGLLSDKVEVRWDEAPAADGSKPMYDRWLDAR